MYGPTIKELIHEEFGDGIMSAINFRLDVRREADPAGDRVVVTLDGKFLPYGQWGAGPPDWPSDGGRYRRGRRTAASAASK